MQHFVKTTLAIAMLAVSASVLAAPKPATVNVSPAERTKIEEVVRGYLMNNPEIIIESVQNFQRKQYEQAEATFKKTKQAAPTFAGPLFQQTNDPVAGNPQGKITVVEFFDYQCPHCVDMAPIIDSIIKANPDVRVVFKEFPIRGPLSDFASRAALAANKQGKYYEFSHALLTANKPITEELVLEIAKNNGVDVEQLKKDMNDNTISNQLKNNIKLAQDLKLFGTPAFFVGKTDATGTIEYFPGRIEQNQLQGFIDKAK